MTYFLFKSAQPFSSFRETNEQQLIFINKKKKKIIIQHTKLRMFLSLYFFENIYRFIFFEFGTGLTIFFLYTY